MTPLPLRSRISGFNIRSLLLAACSVLALTLTAFAAVSSKKNYDLPVGDAAQTLKLFSEQSGEQIIYPVEQVRGQQTNAVQGELTAREALDAMLAKTGLMAVQDEKTGALAVRKSAPAEKTPAPIRRAEPVPVSESSSPRNPVVVKDEDQVLVLSPFEVSANEDNGYAAETTLAGNRLNTELRDIGSAVSVVTAQMLKDIGATSNETLLQYTTNTEVGNIYGNMANAGSGTQLDETSKFVAPNNNTRVRGLASADNTIDFFLTDIPWDSYNVERVDFQRGPNSILFGLGSPAGIINAGSKQAGYRNKGKLEFRYSRFGSMRTTLDYNYVLLPKELSVRLNLLDNNEQFQQEPAYQHDRRVAAAVRYEPRWLNRGSMHTTFKANYENGEIRSNRPRSLPPGDAITPWFLSGPLNGFTATGAPAVYNNMNRMGFDARGIGQGNITALLDPTKGNFNQTYVPVTGGSAVANPYWQPWLGGQFASNYFGNPAALFESDGSGARFFKLTASTPRGLNAAGAIDGGINGVISAGNMSSVTIFRDVSKKINLPGAVFGLTRNIMISDPTIFDFYNNLIDGPNKREWQNFEKYNFNLSSTFFNGNAGIEVVYDRQSYDNGQLSFMTDKGQNIFIDIFAILPDGSANPNFGRPFIGDPTTNNNVGFFEREAKRGTVYVRHDFAKGKHSSWLMRTLGRHVLTGFANDESVHRDNRSFVRYGTDLSYKEMVSSTANLSISDSARAIFPVIYLGPTLKDRTSASGAYIPRPFTEAVAKTGSIRVFDSTWTATSVLPSAVWQNPAFPVGNPNRNSTESENPANYKGWGSIPFNVLDSEEGNRDALTRDATRSKNTVSSVAGVWNGYFWDGALVGMYGWRHDISKAWTRTAAKNLVNQANLSPDSYVLPANYRDRIDEQSRSWSAVAHLEQFFPKLFDRLPVNVSVFYNQSSNFAAVAGRVGPLAENLGAPSGSTKDMGIVIGTKSGNYSLKLNKYKSNAVNVSSNGFNIFYLRQLFTDYHPWMNVYKNKIDGNVFTLGGPTGTDTNRWSWIPALGQTQVQADAERDASIVAWESMISKLPTAFLSAYNLKLNEVRQYTDSVTPAGLTVTEDNVSEGYEIELNARPIQNLRLTFNTSKTEATRTNVGQPSLISLVTSINTALNTTAAGNMRNNFGGTSATALTSWNNNMWASFVSIKAQEGGAVPELRNWRANFVANYDFKQGMLKGVNVGFAARWQGKAIVGYDARYIDGAGNPAVNPQVAKAAVLVLDKPFYAPAETNFDVWVGYRRALTKKITYNVQLNVRNVGETNNLIPTTYQADGSVANWRIAPTQVWSITNTLEF